MGSGDVTDPVTQSLDEGFKVHGDNGFIFNNEDAGRHLGADFFAGFINQECQLLGGALENGRGIGVVKAFN